MTFQPHFRLTMSGDIKGEEIFSCSLSLAKDNDLSGDILALLAGQLTDVNFADMVDDVTAFWGRAGTNIHQNAKLTRVKVAAIDENGHYAGAPKEAAVSVPGANQGAMFPFQVARKVTLETDADLGRVKGGFYLPGVPNNAWSQDTNLKDVAEVQAVADSVKTLINDLNNAPYLDAIAFQVVIASQGRRAPNGAVRLEPTNAAVKRINVGRRVDVQRRRANKVSEARVADTIV